MNKNIIIGVLIVGLVGALLFMVFSGEKPEDSVPEEGPPPMESVEDDEDSEEEEEEPEEGEEFNSRLEETVNEFVGKPYKQAPLESGSSEEEVLYTEKGFNSTTLVLSVTAKVHSEEEPGEAMKEINYHPQGEVSYENRLHFSSYRNKISPYFKDITGQLEDEYVESKTVTLNKDHPEEGRLIDIDWQEEITLNYVSVEDIPSVVSELPAVTGVMFVVDGDKEIGLDVRSEGILLNGEDIVYASSSEEEVVKEDFSDFLEGSGYDGVSFYEFKEVELDNS